MLAVPNLHIEECTETKGPLHPLLVLGCIPSSSHLHLLFFFFSLLSPVLAQFSALTGDALGMCFLHSFSSTQHYPTIQHSTAQYTLVFPHHTKYSQQCFPSVGTSTSCSRSFTLSQCTEQPIKPKSTAMAQFPFQTSPHDATQVQNAIPTRR